MTMTLTKTHLRGGVWEGELTGAGADQPQLEVRHQNEPVDGLTLEKISGRDAWAVQVPVPMGLIADGVQTFVIVDASTGTTLSSFALLSGEALAEDIRAEVDLLRAELDLLKRSFRRHCNETQ